LREHHWQIVAARQNLQRTLSLAFAEACYAEEVVSKWSPE
jgi:hypothetical protein